MVLSLMIIGRQIFFKIDSILSSSLLNRRKIRVIGTIPCGGFRSTRGTFGERDGVLKTDYCCWQIGRRPRYVSGVNGRANSRLEDGCRLGADARVEAAAFQAARCWKRPWGRTKFHRLVSRPLSRVVLGPRLVSGRHRTPDAITGGCERWMAGEKETIGKEGLLRRIFWSSV